MGNVGWIVFCPLLFRWESETAKQLKINIEKVDNQSETSKISTMITLCNKILIAFFFRHTALEVDVKQSDPDVGVLPAGGFCPFVSNDQRPLLHIHQPTRTIDDVFGDHVEDGLQVNTRSELYIKPEPVISQPVPSFKNLSSAPRQITTSIR